MTDSYAALASRLASSALRGFEFRTECMRALSELPGYDWCGVYRLEGDVLVLDAFVGAATDHDRIPVGRGVCGAAVATGENQVVEDVWAIDDYLACSLETKSEIVVLVREPERGADDGQRAIMGQIDIDSHTKGRFGKADEDLLERLAAMIADRW